MARDFTFQLVYPVRRASELEHVAEKMGALKKHGKVEVVVCHVAEKTAADIPPGGSSWHDYTSYLATWQKFFPHDKMKPFLDTIQNHPGLFTSIVSPGSEGMSVSYKLR